MTVRSFCVLVGFCVIYGHMKRAIIVHRWSGSSESDWYPWLKASLEEKGYTVAVPTIPDSDTPTIDAWQTSLTAAVGALDDELVFVGHSIGCQAVLRYLASIASDTKIANVVLVAPWLRLAGLEGPEEVAIAKPWLQTPIAWDVVRAHAPNATLIFSDNDEYVPSINHDLFAAQWPEAKVVMLHNMGHITDVTELPEALAAI